LLEAHELRETAAHDLRRDPYEDAHQDEQEDGQVLVKAHSGLSSPLARGRAAGQLSCLVPSARLELAQLSPLPPQDSVSTNFTTSAHSNSSAGWREEWLAGQLGILAEGALLLRNRACSGGRDRGDRLRRRRR